MEIKYRLILSVVTLLISMHLDLAGPKLAWAQTLPNEVKVDVYHLCQGVNNPSGCQLKGQVVIGPDQLPVKCAFGDAAYGCGINGTTYPFTQNPITISLEDYVKGVMFNELSFGSSAALQAQATVARTYAVRQTNWGSIAINNSTQYQIYIPNSGTSLTDQAVTQTAGYYLTYDNIPAFAEYSPDHIDSHRTNPGLGGEPYLISVYDPIPPDDTILPDPNSHGRGLAQLRAITWGYGFLEDNDYYPIWDLLRILAHYFTAIEFQNVPNVRNDYRFNVIRLTNFPDNTTFYTTERRKDDIVVLLQNTGTLDWFFSKFDDTLRQMDVDTQALKMKGLSNAPN